MARIPFRYACLAIEAMAALAAVLFSCQSLFGEPAPSGDAGKSASPSTVSIAPLEDRYRVSIGGELFTEYVFRGYEKPILYPIIGPHGIGMTRNYPMKGDVRGEAHDHPHHKSMWFAHRPINGYDMWSTFPDAGKCVHHRLLKLESGAERGMLQTANYWIAHDGKLLFTDTRTLRFLAIGAARAIDWEITIHASQGEVVFGDSKEGTMAIRTHPNLQLDNDPARGVTTANGQALNSEGATGKEVWGKRADWIDYWAKIGGHTVGIAIFDHPANPRHPTHWMARGYGYIGANPFGLNAFEGKPLGTGDMKIPAGQNVTFRYRFLFHEGDPQQADLAGAYRAWEQAGE
ncbi:MAG: PmoA family protein [Pirellulales bacterium]|nr:PmoA family protein [Pirellulales bacterium]